MSDPAPARLVSGHPAAAVGLLIVLLCVACDKNAPTEGGSSGDAGLDAGTDGAGGVDVPADTAAGADTSPAVPVCPGGTGCPCDGASDCDSTVCISTNEGQVCAATCVNSCPEGLSCQNLVGGADGKSFCIPTWGTLCRPCDTNAQCAASGLTDARCVAHGDAGGFCGAPCAEDGDCPSDSRCATVSDTKGATTKQCVPKGDGPGGMGQCSCSTQAQKTGLSTTCWVPDPEDQDLLCKGSRHCGTAGLSACQKILGAAAECVDAQCAGKPDKTPCDDGDACTIEDACAAGTCAGGLLVCQCASSADCAKLEDGDPCNGTLYCDTSGDKPVCKVNPATLVTCATSSDTACRKNLCDKASGACAMTDLDTKAPCDDGDACTGNDSCDGKGGCAAGKVDLCQCKVDSDCASKEDGDVCNGTMYCDKSGGTAICKVNPATAIVCPSAGDTACVKNTCQAKTGLCLPQPVAGVAVSCNDGNPCTVGEVCDEGACKASPKANACACASDADCKGKNGGDLCLGELFCNVPVGKCQPNPAAKVSCKTVDDTACTKTSCQPKTGLCEAVASADGTACDADGSACTTGDACKGGSCVAGAQVCVCQSDADCADKEDGNLCNGVLYCDKSGKTPQCKVNPSTVKSCPSVDDTACLKNVCQPKTGKCAKTPQLKGAPCDDGDPCTTGDFCDKGTCSAGADACPCKVDGDCTKFDQDLCDGPKACKALGGGKTACVDVPGAAVDCSKTATAPCQEAVCVPSSGSCVPKPVKDGVSCTDAKACAVGGTCKAGACTGGEAPGCDDSEPCTTDSCSPGKGCTHAPATGATCDDGDPCTGSDACDKGSCGGKAVSCDDANPCTKDSCDSKAGCAHQATAAACDDGDACTKGELCQAKVCKGGAAVDCDDANPCTVDSCDKLKGCSHKADVGKKVACYTGQAGTEGKGVCKGGQRTCGSDGKLGATCEGEIVPAPKELCDDVDNTCDGTTDEGCVGPIQKLLRPKAKQAFGQLVLPDGDALVVNAGGPNNGSWTPALPSIYVYRRDGSGAYKQVDEVKPTDVTAFNYFGHSMALDDATGLLVTGDSADSTKVSTGGAIHVFHRPKKDGKFALVKKHYAPTLLKNGAFGRRVRLNVNTTGGWLSVSRANQAIYKVPAALYLFPISADGKLGTPQMLSGDDSADLFAWEHEYADASTLVVSAAHDSAAVELGGAFWVVTKTGATWKQAHKVASPTPTKQHHFGNHIAVDGTTVAAGSAVLDGVSYVDLYALAKTGAVSWTARIRGPWSTHKRFNASLQLQGDRLIAGSLWSLVDGVVNRGEVNVFERTAPGTWLHRVRLVGPAAGRHWGTHTRAVGTQIYSGDYQNVNDAASAWVVDIKGLCPSNAPCRCEFESLSFKCSQTLPTTTCGDGLLHFGEGCDDGNKTDHDGCSAACKPECPVGYRAVTIHDGTGASHSCMATGPVWGARSSSPGAQFTATGDVVSDKQTGLMWQKAAQSNKTWDQAQSYCDGLTLGGHKDWRLPSIPELQTVWDFKTNGLPQPAFGNTAGKGGLFWSAQKDPAAPANRMQLKLDTPTPWSRAQTNTDWVRCVRTDKTLTAVWPRFVLEDLGASMRDRWTGLAWPTAKVGKQAETWSGAKAACSKLVYAGHSDWRQPTTGEALSLHVYEQARPFRSPLLSATELTVTTDHPASGSFPALNYHGAGALGWGGNSTATAKHTCVRGP